MANREQSAIFQQGVEVWNEWRQKNQDVEVDLSGLELSNSDLNSNFNGVNLRGAKLNGAKLAWASCVKADFSNADLSSADFTGTILSSSDLSEANLNEVNLYGANLTGVDLRKADLSKANLSEADLSEVIVDGTKFGDGVILDGVTFRGTNLRRVNLHRVRLRKANLSNVNLYGANLNNADLSEADLSKADLSGVKLNKANLSGADLSEVTLSGVELSEVSLGKANLTNADLSGVDLSGIDLCEAELIGAKLVGTNFSQTNLSKANLSEITLSEGLNLSGADLSGSKLIKSNLKEVNFSKADLCEADLFRANLTSANLDEANLSRANLSEAKLLNATLNKAVFRWADLIEADLSNAVLNSADFSGAKLKRANLLNTQLLNTNLYLTNLESIKNGHFSDFSECYFNQQTQKPTLSNQGWINSIVYILLHKMQILWRQFDWSMTRKFGSLQILTKVSYTALLLIPILAGLWPVVNNTIHTYNDMVLESGLELHESILAITRQIKIQEQNVRNDTILDKWRKTLEDKKTILEQKAEMIRSTLADAVIEKKYLPYGFASAFFAALLIVLGHLIYEMSANDLIKKVSLSEEMQTAVASFNDEGPDCDKRLSEAIFNIKEIAKIFPSDHNSNLVQQLGRVIWIPDNIESISSERSYRNEVFKSDEVPQQTILSDKERKIIIIEEGAKANYKILAHQNHTYSLISFFFYVTAMVLILSIIITQARNVASQAGWI